MQNEPLYDPKTFPEVEAPSDEDMEMFKQQVSEWVKLDEQIKKLHVALRERKVHQRALGQKVQEFMVKYGYDNLNTQQGRIRSKVREVAQPIKLGEVKSKLKELGHEELVEKLFNSERPKVQKQSLTRIVPKVSLHLDL